LLYFAHVIIDQLALQNPADLAAQCMEERGKTRQPDQQL